MAGTRSDDGVGSTNPTDMAKIEGSAHSDKFSRRASSETNSCSRSIDEEHRTMTDVAAAHRIEVNNAPSDDEKQVLKDQFCKSSAQDTDKGVSILQKLMKPEHQISKRVVDESDAVSDISGSESGPSSIGEEWILNDRPDDKVRRTTICSIITNPSDHGSIHSIHSLRETVDRVLMSSSQNSLERGDLVNRSRSDSRECMQKNFSPAVAQMLYDQNYYRNSDWLRFVPRRSSHDDISSREGSSSSGPGSSSNLTPDRFYRMFDNTKIKVGLNSSGQGRTVVRDQENQHVQDDKLFAPTQVENFRLMHPDLVIDGTIDEEEIAAGAEDADPVECMIETKSNMADGLDREPPTQEIYCDPNSDSCQIALEDEHEIKNDEKLYDGPEVSNEIGADYPNMQSYHSALRKGAIVRPSNPEVYRNQVDFHNLPEHLREEEMHKASWDSKYETYACRVDQTQDDRAVEIPVFSMARPHMRAFHFAWISFFLVFLAWFSIAPLLSEIQISLDLTREQIWTSSIFSVAGGLVTRCIMGVLCDIYGARLMTAAILFMCGLPTCFTGLVNTSIGLSVLRLVIGIGGSAFVTCQYWTSTMFTREVAGTANALAAGWGNLGGGVTYIVTGSILFPFFKWMYGAAGAADPASLAWRTSCIIPGLICVAFTFVVLRSSDDSPKGNYQKRKRLGLMQKQSAVNHLKAGALDFNTWILLIQYGCCFGVELTATNAIAMYFREEFDLSTASAAAVGSVFGLMNIFFRGLGGFLSDVSNAYKGMRGRLYWQLITFFFEGIFIIVFSKAQTLGGAVASLIAFSIFVQAAEGSTFGIVPYLNPSLTGTVSGIIGAGGNAGGVIFSVIFRQQEYRQAFLIMGVATSAISLLSCCIWIKGYDGLFLKRRIPNQASQGGVVNRS